MRRLEYLLTFVQYFTKWEKTYLYTDLSPSNGGKSDKTAKHNPPMCALLHLFQPSSFIITLSSQLSPLPAASRKIPNEAWCVSDVCISFKKHINKLNSCALLCFNLYNVRLFTEFHSQPGSWFWSSNCSHLMEELVDIIIAALIFKKKKKVPVLTWTGLIWTKDITVFLPHTGYHIVEPTLHACTHTLSNR